MKEELIEEDEIRPIFSFDIIGKDDFFERLIDFENNIVYENIETEISSILEDEDKATYIKGIYDELGILLKRLSRLEDADHVKKKLLEIIIYLRDMYSNLIEHHNILQEETTKLTTLKDSSSELNESDIIPIKQTPEELVQSIFEYMKYLEFKLPITKKKENNFFQKIAKNVLFFIFPISNPYFFSKIIAPNGFLIKKNPKTISNLL